MYLVSDVIEMAKYGPLANLAIARNDRLIMKYVHLAAVELYRRFNLSIKVESVETNPDMAMYELMNKDVDLILNLYDSNGRELEATDVLGEWYDYKIINYKSFLLNKPRTDLLFAVYKASPKMIEDVNEPLGLPDSMVPAIVIYVGYLGHSSINKDNANEAQLYYQRFKDAVEDLDNQGYRVPISIEAINLRLKGYV